MAVKLLEVTGTPLAEAEKIDVNRTPYYTQDFLFATHDAFFLPNPNEYLDFLKCVRNASSGIFAFYRDRFPRLWSGFVALVASQVRGRRRTRSHSPTSARRRTGWAATS